MKNTRRGLGKGLGVGYKNLAPMDSHIHSLSAKGVKTQSLYGRSVAGWWCPCGYGGTYKEMAQHKLTCEIYKKWKDRDDKFKKKIGLTAKGKKGKENPTYQEMESLATEIEAFLKKNDLLEDTAIYFKGVRWNYGSDGKKLVEKGYKASEYFDYANDKTLSMSFEGGLYGVLNGHYGQASYKLGEQFSKILEKYGYYYELGNAWNLAITPI